MKKLSILKATLVTVILTGSVVAYQSSGSARAQENPGQATDNTPKAKVSAGAKMEVKGLILKRDQNTFVLRDQTGSELNVRLAGNTKIEEKKSNPFRGAKRYTEAQVVRGLTVEVEGRGDSSGDLVAEKIKFTDDDQRVAQMVDSQIVPVEKRLGNTENRLSRTEQNAERLAGQIDELSQVANLAKGGAAAAQESADLAIDGVNKTNDRISAIDDYEVRKSITVNFKVGSAILSPDAKLALDDIAAQAKNERSFVIEVRGFASSDGSENMNRALSQRRAEAVVRYLAEQHDVSMRRIVIPYGYGEVQPVAENTTRDGRIQNRRAEVKILVSRGLTTPVNVTRSVGTNRQ
ncbi:MAG TPA: OmpA family protein [Blastocatellia bacterium]|nr:OmpA family protein [Blastocatellia bacterium]